MASLAVTNTFSSLATITASGHNQNFSDVVNYINNRNSGSSSWDVISSAGNISSAGIFLSANGTLSAPSISFTNDTTKGFYHVASNQLGIAINGALQWNFNGTVFSASSGTQIQMQNGSASVPGYSFGNATTSGLYRSATNQVSMAAGGTQVAVFGSSGVAILGTTTNDSASSGFVGETMVSDISSATNTGTDGVRGDLTSLALTAGDWIVYGHVLFTLNGATCTAVEAGISSTSGNSTTGTTFGTTRLNGHPPTSNYDSCIPLNGIRTSIASPTTYYLKYMASFSAGQPQARGHFLALRVR